MATNDESGDACLVSSPTSDACEVSVRPSAGASKYATPVFNLASLSEVTKKDGGTVGFWFDPGCPWTWLTFRWLQEAATVRDLSIQAHLLSLAMLNEDRDESERYRAIHQAGLESERVIMAARALRGEAVVLPLYEAFGKRIHVEGRSAPEDYPEIIAEALAELGLPAVLAGAAQVTKYDAEIRAEHNEGMSRVGTDVGAPVVAIGEVAFFGPVVSPAPRGEAAGLLWDGCLLVAKTPGFFELKRTRTAPAIIEW